MNHQIELTEYEIANLRAAIEAIGYPYDEMITQVPIKALNTGDWVGQIYNKLPQTNYLPNHDGSYMAATNARHRPIMLKITTVYCGTKSEEAFNELEGS